MTGGPLQCHCWKIDLVTNYVDECMVFNQALHFMSSMQLSTVHTKHSTCNAAAAAAAARWRLHNEFVIIIIVIVRESPRGCNVSCKLMGSSSCCSMHGYASDSRVYSRWGSPPHHVSSANKETTRDDLLSSVPADITQTTATTGYLAPATK